MSTGLTSVTHSKETAAGIGRPFMHFGEHNEIITSCCRRLCPDCNQDEEDGSRCIEHGKRRVGESALPA